MIFRDNRATAANYRSSSAQNAEAMGLLLIIAAVATQYQTLLTVSYRSIIPQLLLNHFLESLPPTAGQNGVSCPCWISRTVL